MKITKAKLTKLKACDAGIRWFLAQKETDHTKICEALIADNHSEWANWLIVGLMTPKQKRMYVIYAAEQVIEIYEKRYPGDDRPRKAIKAAKTYLKNPSKKNKDATTYAAAYAAYAAIDAAYAAAYAAYAAAYAADATIDAAYAAAYAADAAVHAAYAAAYAAERKEIQTRIINYGVKLIARKP